MSGDLDLAEKRLATALQTICRRALDHQSSRRAAGAAQSERRGAQVFAERSTCRVRSATGITPTTRSPACMQHSVTPTRPWRGWNAVSTPGSPVGRSSGSIHISNTCVRSPNSHG